MYLVVPFHPSINAVMVEMFDLLIIKYLGTNCLSVCL